MSPVVITGCTTTPGATGTRKGRTAVTNCDGPAAEAAPPGPNSDTTTTTYAATEPNILERRMRPPSRPGARRYAHAPGVVKSPNGSTPRVPAPDGGARGAGHRGARRGRKVAVTRLGQDAGRARRPRPGHRAGAHEGRPRARRPSPVRAGEDLGRGDGGLDPGLFLLASEGR